MIKKFTLEGREIDKQVARDLCQKYVRTYIAMECLMGGIPVETPEGMLQAEVEFDLCPNS